MSPRRSLSLPSWPLLLLGASSAVLQTVAVRESLATLGGNEAVVALVFGAWLSLTALGAHLGRRPSLPSIRSLIAGFVTYAACGPLTLLAARRAVLLLPPGVEPPLGSIVVVSVLLLAPACVLSGWLYAGLARPAVRDAGSAADTDGLFAARAWWLDALGAAAAGVALALVLLDRLLPFAVAGLSGGLALLAAAALAAGRRRLVLAMVGVCVAAGVLLAPVDRATLPWTILGQSVASVSMSPRGPLVVARRQGQTQLLLHRSALLTDAPSPEGDELAHLTAASHDHPRDVLVVGVVPSFTLRALRAQGVERIDEVVGDDRIASQVRLYAPDARDDGVTISGADERLFVRSAPASSYDLVLVHGREPLSIGAARLYSKEVFAEIARVLRPGGRVVVTLPGHASYANLDQRRMHSVVASTLRAVFPSVVALPADLTLYVAAQELPPVTQLAQELARRIDARGVQPQVATAAWVRETLTPERLADAQRWCALDEAPSTDAHPVVHSAALEAALSQFDDHGLAALAGMAAGALGLALVWARPRTRPVPFSIATTGFASLALQLVLMLAYQAAVGALYRDVALINALFMASAGGASWWLARSRFSRRRLIAADAAQVGAAVAIALLAPWFVARQGWEARVAIASAAAVVGAATGIHIALAARAPSAFSTARGGAVFAVDLLGAALAALLTYTLAVPALGLAGTALAVAGIKASSTLALALPPALHPAPLDRSRGLFPTAVLVSVVVLAVLKFSSSALASWTASNTFSLCVLTVLAVQLASPFQPPSLRARLVRIERRTRHLAARLGLSPLRLAGFALLLPVAALPLGRCYFRVPYVLCHACPRPCTFGLVRPYLVTGALLANVGDHRFCERLCPLGQAQQAAARWRSSPLLRLGWSGVVARLILAFVVACLYVAVRGVTKATAESESVFAWAFTNAYSVSLATLSIAALFIVLSFIVHRPFCDGACPIGALSDLTARAERWWVRRGHSPTEGS